MANVNQGVLDGLRRLGAKVRDLTVDGGLPGAPLGFRLRGATQSGAPATGTWKTGDLVPDRNGVIWTCTAGGTPGTWTQSLSRPPFATVYNVKAYGAQGDGVILYANGAMTNGSAVVTDSSASWSPADTGKCIMVGGAGAGGAALVTTIASVQSATSVTVAANASTTVSTAQVVYGTNDQAAIQAAIQAAFSAGGGKAWLPLGIYILGGNYSTIPGFAGDNSQYLLYAPYQPTTGAQVTVEVEGEVGVLPLPLFGENANPAGVCLYNLSPQSPAPATSPYPWVIGGGNTSHNNVAFGLRNVIIRQMPATSVSNTVSGVNLASFPNFDLENVRVDVDALVSSGAPSSAPFPDPSLSRGCTGVQTTAAEGNTGLGVIRNTGVIGYNQGLTVQGQAEIWQFYAAYCKVAVTLFGNEAHPKAFYYLNTNNCPHVFQVLTSSTVAQVACYAADLQGNNNSGTWMYSADHFLGHSGATISGIVNAAVNFYPSSFVLSGFTGTLAVNPLDGLKLPVTLSGSAAPSAPVSGTIYLNTTGSPLYVYVPAYATSGGTAGSVAVAYGSSGTPPTVYTKYVSGSTTSSLVDVVELRVPPGQYFSLTASGVTFGTALYEQLTA